MLYSFLPTISATDTIAQAGAWSSPMFDELLIPALIVMGCLLAVGVFSFLLDNILDLFDWIGEKISHKQDY